MSVALKSRYFESNHLENKLNILTADLQSLNLKKFFEYSPFQKEDLSRIPALRESNKYGQSVELKELKSLRKGIMQVVAGMDLAIELHQNNVEEAVHWFQEPNSFLFGDSPFEVCIRGDGEEFIEWLWESVKTT